MVVQVMVLPATGASSAVNSTPLAGTTAVSSAAASVTLSTGMSVLFAMATIPITTANATPMIIKGEKVERMEITASYSGPSAVFYITQSGRRLNHSMRPDSSSPPWPSPVSGGGQPLCPSHMV
jgi:hypothetical protein